MQQQSFSKGIKSYQISTLGHRGDCFSGIFGSRTLQFQPALFDIVCLFGILGISWRGLELLWMRLADPLQPAPVSLRELAAFGAASRFLAFPCQRCFSIGSAY